MNGTVFDIKEFSIHDGPGGRVTVFFKGCPLRCVWCHNPEGLSAAPELLFRKTLCTGCGRCRAVCRHAECKSFGRCIHACASGALSVAGNVYRDDELAGRLVRYRDFFAASGGGVTFSGGEPMMQGAFVIEVAKRLPGIHKTVQTSGYADPALYQAVVSHMDYVMQDVKLADSGLHKTYTGVSNETILENIAYLKTSGKAFVFRIPLIPGITDTAENLSALSAIVGDFPVELLPYNVLAGAKYPLVGRTYPLGNATNRAADYTGYFTHATIRSM